MTRPRPPSPDELAWMREHGADLAQGFLFAHPADPPPLPSA